MLAELIGGWREFKARPWLWGVIAVWSVYGITVLGPITPLEAVVVTERHSSAMFGLMMTVNGAGSVVGGLIAMRLRPRRPLYAGTFALFGVIANVLVLAYDVSVPVLAAGFLVGGVSLAFWLVMWSTTVQTQIPNEALNRLHAYDVAGSLIMLAVGRALAGPVAEAVGTREVLVAGAVINIGVCAVLLGVRAIRNLQRVGASRASRRTVVGQPPLTARQRDVDGEAAFGVRRQPQIATVDADGARDDREAQTVAPAARIGLRRAAFPTQEGLDEGVHPLGKPRTGVGDGQQSTTGGVGVRPGGQRDGSACGRGCDGRRSGAGSPRVDAAARRFR